MSIVKVSDKQIQSSYDGFELYYEKQDRILYSSINALARWLECNAQTIKNQCVKLGVGKDAEAHTVSGLQGVKLLTSAEVVKVLRTLSDSKRVKEQTRKNANARLDLLATLGNELGGMLAVAPEELAKLAIDRTTSIEQIQEVQEHVVRHNQYLKEYHGLHDTLKERGADDIHHATINKHNNELANVRPGSRDYMTQRQKDEMTYYQLTERMKLANTKTNGAWHAVNVCKLTGTKAKSALKGILGE